MKREDIVIGVEYSKTGPHAYGREPSVKPVKVRFVSLQPDMRLLTEWEWQEDPVGLGQPGWTQVGEEFITSENALAYPDNVSRHFRVERERNRTNYGHRTKVVERVKGAGLLPAEERRFNKLTRESEWVKTLVAPAAVHRTWEAQLKLEQDFKDEASRAKRRRAPAAYRNAIEEVVEFGMLVDGMTLEHALQDVREQWDRKTLRY